MLLEVFNYFIFPVSVVLLLGSIAAPNRTREFVNNFFAFIISPITELRRYTQNYIDGFSERNKKILNSVGIKSEYIQRTIGSTILFLISTAAMLCDIDLIVMTLQALEIVPESKTNYSILNLLGFHFSPSILIAIAIVSSGIAWGILIFDAKKNTTFTPNFLFDGENKTSMIKIFSFVGYFMIILTSALLITLAFVRWDALNFDPSQQNIGSMGYEILFVFIGTTILAFFTSFIVFIVFVAFLGALAVLLHSLFIVPVFVIHLILNIINQIANVAFNLFLALVNLIAGLTFFIRNKLQKKNMIDDSSQEDNILQNDNNNFNRNQNSEQNPDYTPLFINEEFGNLTGEKALLVNSEPIVIDLQNFVRGGRPPYTYSFFADAPNFVQGEIADGQLILRGNSRGNSDCTLRVNDEDGNSLDYQFTVEVMQKNMDNLKNIDACSKNNHHNNNDNDDEFEVGFNPLKI